MNTKIVIRNLKKMLLKEKQNAHHNNARQNKIKEKVYF